MEGGGVEGGGEGSSGGRTLSSSTVRSVAANGGLYEELRANGGFFVSVLTTRFHQPASPRPSVATQSQSEP